MNKIIFSVFKYLLEKSDKDKQHNHNKLITALTKVTAWGGRRHYYHDSTQNNEDDMMFKNPVSYWENFLKNSDREENDEFDDEDDTEVKEKHRRQIAPANMQEALKKVALTHRSPLQREDAIKRLPEDFLIEQVNNPKQQTRVRQEALQILISDGSKEIVKFAQDKNLPQEIREKALDNIDDKKVIYQAIKDGYTKALLQLDLKSMLEFPETLVKESLKGQARYGRRRTLWEKKLKDASPKIRKEFINKYADEIDSEYISPYFKEFKDNKKLLRNVFSKTSSYRDDLQASIVLLLKEDKDFLTSVVVGAEGFDDTEPQIQILALDLLGGTNKAFYNKLAQTKEFAKTGPQQQNFILNKVDDQDVLKKAVTNVGKNGYSLDDEVFTKIKDKAFLKKLYEKTKIDSILTGIDDNEYKKNIYEKNKNKDYFNCSVLKYITDNKYLISIYEANLPEKEAGRDIKESKARIRNAAVKGMTDKEMLQKIAKKDPNFDVRIAAVENINDPVILENILLRETSKTAKMNMLNIVKNQDALIALHRKEKDSEIRARIDSRLTPESAITLLKEDRFVSTETVKKIDRNTLKQLLLKSQDLMERYIRIFYKDEEYLLTAIKKYPSIASDVIDHIKNQKVLKKLFEAGHVNDLRSIDNLQDRVLLKTYLIENGTRDVLEAFEKLNPSQEELLEILENTKSDRVRQEGSKLLLTNPDSLKKYLLENDVTIDTLKNAWSQIKDDKEFLAKFVSTQESVDIIEKVLPKVSDNKEALKKILQTLGRHSGYSEDALFGEIVALLNDPEYVKSILFDISERKYDNIAENLTSEDIMKVLSTTKTNNFERIEGLFRRGYRGEIKEGIDFIKVYQEAKSPTVKEAVVLVIPPENFTKEMLNYFVEGLKQTQRPYEVSNDLVAKAYEWGTDSQQDELKGFVDESIWVERHKEAKERPYTVPEKGRGDKIKHRRIEHDIEKNPNYQLFRLLVLMAR